ncbi:HAD family hydrolase [soil metagenome]
MQPIKGVIFDCDGVLVDSEIIASKVSLRELKKFGFEMSIDEYSRQFAGKVEEDIMNIIKTKYNISLPEDFIPNIRLEIDKALDHDLEPIKGVKDTISNIKSTLAVVSNSRLHRVLHSLKIAGLSEFFNKNVFSAEMVEKPKPDPALYKLAATELNLNPSECLVVEDSFSGVTSAYNAGMNVIGFLGASHIHNGHDIKLKEAGAFTTANHMEHLKEILFQILNKN